MLLTILQHTGQSPPNKTESTPAVSNAGVENPPPASARRTLRPVVNWIRPHKLLQLTPDSWNILDALHGYRRLRLSTGTHSCHSTTFTAFPHLVMQDTTIVSPTRDAPSLPHGVSRPGECVSPAPLPPFGQGSLEHSISRYLSQ